MLTQCFRYAPRPLIYLAGRQGEKPVEIAAFTERRKVVRKRLELILFNSKQAGFVEPLRGRAGLHRPKHLLEEVALAAVDALADGPPTLPFATKSADGHYSEYSRSAIYTGRTPITARATISHGFSTG